MDPRQEDPSGAHPTRAGGSDWHDLGAVDRFRDGVLYGFLRAGLRLCVGRTGDRFFAIDDTCPHAGGSLCEGLLDEDLVICPLHAYGFETGSGRCVDDPTCSVSVYEVRVERGSVAVRLSHARRVEERR